MDDAYRIEPRIEIGVQWLEPDKSTQQFVNRAAYASRLSYILTTAAKQAIEKAHEEFKAGKYADSVSRTG